MPNYHVQESIKDYTAGDVPTDYTGITIIASEVVGVGSFGIALIDTSAIGSDIISAATLFWYHDSYLKTKLAAYDRKISIEGLQILSSAAIPFVGWNSLVLTGAAIAKIITAGETQIAFSVDPPAAGQFRIWEIQAWDYVPNGSWSVYLAVTHAPPVAGKTKTSILRVI